MLLIVRIGAAFSCRWLFSACGGLSLHRAYSISPGWNQGGMIGRRPRSVLIPPETAAPFPMACPYSGRRHIPPRRPEEYSFRYHSCSTRVPVYAFGGTADNSSPEYDCG